MLAKSFEYHAAHSAIVAGITSFLYSVSFLFIARSAPSQGALLAALFLLLTGFFASAVFVELYQRLKAGNPGYALWALVLGLAGSLGMMLHGGYDLALAVNPPATRIPSLALLPSPIDPRGLLTFGVGGIAVFVFSYLMSKNKKFPTNLARLGYVVSALMVILYIGRLVILTPTHPVIAYSALLEGIIFAPVFYLWLGNVFYQK